MMFRLRLWLALFLLSSTTPFAWAQPVQIDPTIYRALETAGSTRVIVEIRRTSTSAGPSAAVHVSSVLGGAQAGSVAPIDRETAVANVDRAALERLAHSGQILSVSRDRPVRPALGQSVGAMGAPALWATGATGEGVAIAILDSGIDPQHPFLRDKVVEQACFSVEDPSTRVTSLCPAGQRLPSGDFVEISTRAATGCPADLEGCWHGTHIAGIAAGRELEDGATRISGVAPDAQIVAIQVFSRFARTDDCQPSSAPCIMAFTSSQLRALQFVNSRILNRQATGVGPVIVAVNMSLSSGYEVAPCDANDGARLLAQRIRALRTEGVPTFIAAGNDGYPDAVGFPACIRAAIAIGAVGKPEGTPPGYVMARFSNRAENRLVDLLAIGVGVRSSVNGGGFREEQGTSMATPMVSGAFAVLRAALPNATVDQIEQVLRATGSPVPVPGTDHTLPAINLAAAHGQLAQTVVALAPAGTATRPPSDSTRGDTPRGGGGAAAAGGATRFIVETAPGAAGRSAVAVQRLQGALASRLSVGAVSAARIADDALTITTDGAVDPATLSEALRQVTGEVRKVYVDRTVGPAPGAPARP